MDSPTPKKVAVLGGGVGAMSAAFELTQEPGWRDKYDITVYQLGWRLGGKGASGRELDKGARILEHGLHVWGGFYDNSFRLLRECYDALQRPRSVPIRSLEQAFHAVDQVYLCDRVDDQPHVWRIDFPRNDEAPGSGGVLLTPRDYLVELLEGLAGLVDRFPIGAPPGLALLFAALPAHLAAHLPEPLPAHGKSHLHAAAALARQLPEPGGPLLRLLPWLLGDFHAQLAARTAPQDLNPTLASVIAALEIGTACARGIVADGVLENGFDSIDDVEWTAWAMKHGASRRAMQSCVGRCAYDYVFGFRDGVPDFEHRAVAAGAGTRAMLRLLFTYKGSLFFKLNAGMGDIVFAPIYQLLRQRGVKFRFFHKVTRLGLDADGRRIATIEVERQVELKDPQAEYEPLVEVGGLPCWPSKPDFAQIVDGAKIAAAGVNLESMWSGWNSAACRTLKLGRDFDLVVLGISLGGLPALTAELAQRHRRWQDMLDKVQTVSTQAMQFWFNDGLRQLGWPADSGLLTSYDEPLDTWSDMSFLLPREDWGKGKDGPKQISYFCSTFAPTEPAPPFGANDYPARQLAAMKAAARPWIDQRLTQLLPGTEGAFGKFDCGKLFAPGAHGDEQRLAAQYFRVNVDPPSELYVQSVPGSTKYRLAADGSGIDNLFLAGDWVRTGLNAGCVEAATMAGLQAARAISGRDITIVGESDLAESPLAAQNAPLPWSLAYAQGQISAAIVTLALPLAEAAKLLAPGLKLLPQRLSPAGTHPVGLIFADQRRVRANFLPAGGMDYRECAIAIPFVGFSDAQRAAPVPLMLLPALYLDRLLPTLAGRLFYGYRKHLARSGGAVTQRRVAELLGGAELLRARLVRDGPPGSAYDFEHLGAVRRMMRQPIVTPDPLRGWLYSFLDYRFELATITPLQGSVDAAAQVLGAGSARSWPVASVAGAALGGFQFDGDWTLTNPFESHALEAMLARREAARDG